VDAAALGARLVVAAVLVAAAVAKAVDLDEFARANRSLGVPERTIPAVRVGIPALEVVLAVGLLLTPTASLAAIGAVALFLAFTALLVWNLTQGRRPSCNCFGSTSDEPISWWTVGRNAVLAVLGVVAALGSQGLPEWIGELTDEGGASTAAAVLAGTLVVVAAAAAAVVRTDWRTRRPAETGSAPTSASGLAVGEDVSGELETLRRVTGLSGQLPVLVVRTDPACGPCRALLPRLLSWQSAYAGLLEIAVLTGDVADDGDHHRSVEHLQTGGEDLARRLGLAVTPSAVLVDANGRIASEVVAGGIEIGRLVGEAMRDRDDGRLLQGDPASGVVLASGHGMLSLADLHGAMTLLVFWDPWCGFCQRGLLPLLRWQESVDGDGPRLLVAGQRDDEIAQLQGFQLVGADPDGSVMRLFGGEGTPSAVLIDAAGRVASGVAHGMDEVMALAERSQLLASLGAAPPST
jgi:thiol-disulfide isomerase/thioredoxin